MKQSGVQRAVSYLSALLTHEEVAEAISRLLPLQISAQQVGHVIQPIGERFAAQEDQQVQALFQQGADKRTSEAEQHEKQGEPIKPLYINMNGVMARLRRGCISRSQSGSRV